MGGLEERAGHNANRAAGGPGQASHHRPHHSPDNNKRLSTLFESLRSGLGGGADDGADAPAVGAVGGAAPGCGGVVVQHVSCRRRRDSNSSSNSDSDSEERQRSKRRVYSEMNGAAPLPQGHGAGRYGARSDTESAGRSVGSGSGERDARTSSLPRSHGSDASASTVRERNVEVVRGGGGGEHVSRVPVAKPRPHHEARKGDQPQPARAADGRQRKQAVATGPFQRQNTEDGDRPSSGCSFTSSEWGEVTPTESAPSVASQPPQDRKEEAGSALGHSSGYVSTSRRSIDVGDSVLNNNGGSSSSHPQNYDSPTAPRSKTLPSKLPVRLRQNSQDSFSLEAAHPDTPPHTRSSNNNSGHARATTQGHVRRQSSGRSETLSTCSAKTASPATKMRLLDLASNRALERDGDDSVKSWSAGSEADSLSLGTSCSGVQALAEAPVFHRVHYKRQRGCE